MEPAIYQSSIGAVWADALFVSALQRCDRPSAGQVKQAVAAAVGVFGPLGCAERVAQEFGDHPEVAVTRMRWARTLAAKAMGTGAAKAMGTGAAKAMGAGAAKAMGAGS
jgi:hypothetical protein